MVLINREKRVAKKSDKKFICGNLDKTKDMIEDLKFLKEPIKAVKLKSVID